MPINPYNDIIIDKNKTTFIIISFFYSTAFLNIVVQSRYKSIKYAHLKWNYKNKRNFL